MVRWPCLVVTLAVLAVGGHAAGDFGLHYTVPGFDSAFRSGIGAGVVGVVKANASLGKYEASLDRSGATTVLHAVANNLTTPLNKLLGHVAASFGANGTDSLRALLAELKTLVEPTTASLEVALAFVRALDGAVRPSLVETLAANVSTISTEVGTLARNWPPFGEALEKAAAPGSGYDASNIATLITPDIVQSVTSPVRLINAALADVANAYGTLAKDRTATIGHEAANNASVRNGRQDLDSHLTIVNRTLSDTARQMEQQCNGTVRQIRDGYNGLLARLSSESDLVALVRTFLEGAEAQGLRHNVRAGDLLRQLAGNYTDTVQSSADGIASQLFNATVRLTDRGALSDSGYVERCLPRHVGELRQGAYAVTRLSGCYQADGRTPNYFSSANSAFLEQLRNGALYGNQAQSVCGQGSTNCTSVYLQALEGLGTQNQARFDAFDALLREEMGALSARFGICARAIGADVEALIAVTEQKFNGCLVNGR